MTSPRTALVYAVPNIAYGHPNPTGPSMFYGVPMPVLLYQVPRPYAGEPGSFCPDICVQAMLDVYTQPVRASITALFGWSSYPPPPRFGFDDLFQASSSKPCLRSLIHTYTVYTLHVNTDADGKATGVTQIPVTNTMVYDLEFTDKDSILEALEYIGVLKEWEELIKKDAYVETRPAL